MFLSFWCQISYVQQIRKLTWMDFCFILPLGLESWKGLSQINQSKCSLPGGRPATEYNDAAHNSYVKMSQKQKIKCKFACNSQNLKSNNYSVAVILFIQHIAFCPIILGICLHKNLSMKSSPIYNQTWIITGTFYSLCLYEKKRAPQAEKNRNY